MHLIQAIEEYLISQIDQHLDERLKTVGTSLQTPERKLAEKLRLVGVDATLSRPVASDVSKNPVVPMPSSPMSAPLSNADAAPAPPGAAPSALSSSGSSPLPAVVLSSSGIGPSQEAASFPQTVPVVEVERQMAALALSAQPATSALPPVHIKPKDLRQFSVDPHLGSEATAQIKLHLTGKSSSGQLTWADFMSSTVDDFEVHLKNGLSKEILSDNKMFIVAWFKAQLVKECQIAKENLRRRAEQKKQDKSIQFTDSVDEWLLQRVEALAQEASRLIQLAHDHSRQSTIKVQVPIGGPEIVMNRSLGQSQLLITACALALKNFMQWCKDLNAQRRVVSMDDPRSMLDVYQEPQQPIHHLRQLDKQSALYVIENLFTDAINDPSIQTKKKSMFSWLNIAGHDPGVSKDKRAKLLAALRDITDIAAKYKEENSAYWEAVLDKVDQTNMTLKQCHYLTAYQQRTTVLCRELHSAVLGAAQGDHIAETLARHRKCF